MTDLVRTDRLILTLSLLALSACGDDATPADTDAESTGADTEAMTSGSPTSSPTSTTVGTTATTTDVDTTDTTGSQTTGETTTGETDNPTTTGETDNPTTTGETEGTTTTGETETTTTGDLCGNDQIDGSEDCDGDDLGGETCDSLGRGTGDLACTSECVFDVSDCEVAAACGNGATEAGEACDDNNLEDGDGCSSQCELDGADVCEAPNYVYSVPYSFSADTTDFADDYEYFVGSGTCTTVANESVNGGANDVVFSFTPDTTALYTLDFDFAGDGVMWVVTDCADASTCLVAADAAASGGETIITTLDAGTTYYIIMGHWATEGATAAEGPFTFSVDTCIPTTCDGMFCGDDGCGGTCDCADGQLCSTGGAPTGTCIDAPSGDTCGDALFVDPTALPYSNDNDSDLYANDYGYGVGVCPGEEGGWNAGAEDVAYEFTPDVDGTYTITWTSTWDSTVWVVTDCADIDSTCVAGQDNQFTNDDPETIIAQLSAGTTYYIIGGHWSNSTPGGGGPYNLTVSEPCFPTVCDEVTCGDDGCGGTCGCADGSFCNAGTCEDAPPGDTCADPFVVGALPYTDSNDTDLFLDDYAYSTGVCPGEEGGWSGAAEEVVYAFTPAADGNYTISFTSTWDSTIWIVTDCGDINGTCLAGADALLSMDPPEVITTDLVGGTTYYIMASHYSNTTPGGGGAYTIDIVQN